MDRPTETLKSYRFFYQYDFPLLKSKKTISFLYSGFNLSSHIEEFNLNTHKVITVTGYPVINLTKTLTSSSNIIALSLPLGYKKEISSSGVLIDFGLNLDFMAYGYGKYDFTYYDKNGPSLPIITETNKKGSISTFIFYPTSKNPKPDSDLLNYFISCFYFKILFM